MKKHIICFGDSNTHGYCADPSNCVDSVLARFNEDERWTCLLQKALGEEYLVTEEGLSGRTTVFDDPLWEGLCGLNYLYPCLKSHEPVSLLIIMLGTNDAKSRFGSNAYAIGKGMTRLIQKAKATDCWGPEGKPNLLVIAPPAIGEGVLQSDVADEMGPTCVETSLGTAAVLAQVAEQEHVHFLDAGAEGCTFNSVDFMHLTRKSHAHLAELLAQRIPSLL